MLQHTLFNYKVVENDSNKELSEQNLVELFLAAKRIEGCSEKSLKYYESTILALLADLGNAVISFNDDEEDEPPLHIGDVIGLTELQQFFPNLLKNENQNGIISNVAKCGKKSSLDAILHRQLSRTKRTKI